MATARPTTREWRSFDWSLLAGVMMLIAVGMTAIYSATHGIQPGEFSRQMIYLIPALVAMIVVLLYDYGWLFSMSRWIYWANSGCWPSFWWPVTRPWAPSAGSTWAS